MKSNAIGPIVLILIGLVLLANNLGWTSLSMGRLIATWWPAILVVIGIGRLFGRGR